MLPIDPHADRARRAWLPCPHCRDQDGCEACGAGRTCHVHWRYLLSSAGHVVHLQCPTCAHIWDQDTSR
ncbi:hypothetical protein AB0C59_29025 [Streptomyces sp. NPDC048664]|uniref:hypothetical protein n=1 Tax=Streptomyces sp. NPDC048664 TaxID=3154505 RepID=UPI00341D00F4